MGFEDYGKQKFVQEYQRQLEGRERRGQNRKRLARSAAILLSIGIPTVTAFEIGTYLFAKEEKPKTGEVSPELTEEGSLKVAKPEKLKRAEPRKGKEELSNGEGEPPQPEGSEFAQNLINEKYDQFNETSDFKITFDINDKDSEIREMIERIGLTYGNPDHINLYKAIAAKESRLKWEHSIDGGIGYFQITNIPPSIEKEVSEIAERDKLSEEEANALAGAMTLERSLEYVQDQREQLGQEPNKEEEILLALWAYNIGPKHLDFSLSFEENYQKFKEGHRNYAPDVMAFNEAAGEKGYRR